MDACDTRLTAYKDGRSFQDCRRVATTLVPVLSARVDKHGSLAWDEIMKESEYDAVVYKLVLKYMRQDGYDIGSHTRQSVCPARYHAPSQ